MEHLEKYFEIKINYRILEYISIEHIKNNFRVELSSRRIGKFSSLSERTAPKEKMTRKKPKTVEKHECTHYFR